MSGRFRAIGGALLAVLLPLAVATVPAVAAPSTTQQDVEPPVLASLSLVTAAQYADETTSISYSVTGENAPLRAIRLDYTNDGWDGGTRRAEVTSAPATGSLTPPRSEVPGKNYVTAVEIVDAAGNYATYYRDGTLHRAVPGTSSPDQRHTLDFSTLDVTVKPSTFDGTVRAVPSGARVSTGFSPDQSRVTPTVRVTIQPGGRVVDVPAAGASIGGLSNGLLYSLTFVTPSAWGDSRPRTISVRPMPSTRLFSPGDVDGDRRADVVGLSNGTIHTYWGNGAGGFRSHTTDGGRSGIQRVAPAGPRNPGGRSSYYGIQWDGSLVTPSGTGYVLHGYGWNAMRFIDGGSDLTGDGSADILAVTNAGELYLYPVDLGGQIRPRRHLGAGWAQYTAFFTPGDFDGDRKADVLAMDPSGRLWLYRGNGSGGWLGPRVLLGSGWAAFGAVVPMRDLNGDGRVDVGAVTMGGELYLYPGNGRGGFVPRQRLGANWHTFF